MDSTRISVARLVELGVQVSWREAAAIVHEAVSQTGPTKGARPVRVTADECVITRGGEVVLMGEARKARPETVVRLLEDLLAVCDSPGGLASALESGTALAFLEDLSQRTTAKRRRVEVASAALRALAAAADRARSEADEREAERLAEPAPPVPDRLHPPHHDPPPPVAPAAKAPVPFAEYAARHEAVLASASVAPTPFTRAGLGLATATPALRVVEPLRDEFDLFRSELAAREEERGSGLAERLKQIDKRIVAGILVPLVAGATWYLWPTSFRLPPRPTSADPVPLAAVPLPPAWADLGRIGRRVPTPPPAEAPVAAAPAEATATSPAAPLVSATPVDPAEPPADATVSLVPPPNGAPTVTPTPPVPAPAPAPAPTVPASAPPVRAAAAEPAPASTATSGVGEAIYSWTTPNVEPPMIRYPAMPSWALPAPDARINGPYLEVLVDQQGQVETVRIRGRVEPGETFYRHRMMLASAKLWQFTPARLNGQPVRYVVRVLVEQP